MGMLMSFYTLGDPSGGWSSLKIPMKYHTMLPKGSREPRVFTVAHGTSSGFVTWMNECVREEKHKFHVRYPDPACEARNENT